MQERQKDKKRNGKKETAEGDFEFQQTLFSSFRHRLTARTQSVGNVRNKTLSLPNYLRTLSTVTKRQSLRLGYTFLIIASSLAKMEGVILSARADAKVKQIH